MKYRLVVQQTALRKREEVPPFSSGRPHPIADRQKIMTLLEHPKIVELVRDCTRALFDTMMDAAPEELPDYRTSIVEDSQESVLCLIGFSGEVVGSGSLHCSAGCACRLASALLMGDYRKVDAEVLDAVAEITNMIVGNFKTAIEDSLGVIGISTPTVIYGQSYSARNFGASEWAVVPFRYHGFEFDVRISVQQDPVQVRKGQNNGAALGAR